MTINEQRIWPSDQLIKSEFFRQKLYEWELRQVFQEIDQIKGERLSWNKSDLEISEKAWKRIIHRGIKPIHVFAHPNILIAIPYAITYYRMSAIVFQKSMSQVGLPTVRYEQGQLPTLEVAEIIVKSLNKTISKMIEADESLDAREFDLWRGMAAGSQAQRSWQNAKGRKMEIVVQGMIRRRLRENGLAESETDDDPQVTLVDQRLVKFADEPDIAIYQAGVVTAAVEVKGGIDKAGVLERVGAAIKSLNRAKEENPASVTILLLPEVSLTPQAMVDLQTNHRAVNYWFSIEDVLENEDKRNEVFRLLRI